MRRWSEDETLALASMRERLVDDFKLVEPNPEVIGGKHSCYWVLQLYYYCLYLRLSKI